jgi:integrase
MTGGVRKKGNSWYYYFDLAKVKGKRNKIERVGGKTKKEAESALRKAIQEYENSGLIFEPNEISVADYMDYWFKNYVEINCKYNTKTAYEGIIKNHIKPTLGIYKLKSLTPTILQEFINNKYLTGLSKNHLTNIIGVLSGSSKYAVHPCNFIKDNPMQYVKYPKYEHSKLEIDRRIITNKEFKSMIERFPAGTSFYIPLMIGYHTGFRIGEAMALCWDDIDLDKGFIDVNKIIYKREKEWCFGSPKTESSIRNIQIGKTLIDALKQHKKWQMENRLKYGQYYFQQYEVEETIGKDKLRKVYSYPISTKVGTMQPINMVCTKENGEMITPDSFKYASRVIHYSLGILFNYHSLRHTHATTLIENGANIKDVQKRLGHAHIETTLGTYTHGTEKMSQQSVDIFEKAVSTQK